MAKSKFEEALVKALYVWLGEQYEYYMGECELFGVTFRREKSVKTKFGTNGRIDFSISIFDPDKPEKVVIQYNIEAKSSTSDLNSPWGKNWNQPGGNFIIYPRNAWLYTFSGCQLDGEFLKRWLRNNGYEHVGILALEEDGSITCEKKAIIDDKSYRLAAI